MADKKLPNEKEVTRLLDSYRLPSYLKDHSEKVKEVVLYLARELNNKGEDYDLNLLEVAARLHDLAKPFFFQELDVEGKEQISCDEDLRIDFEFWFEHKKEYAGSDHCEVASDILKEYQRLAEIVRNHSPKQILREELSKEAVLLNYVDKRVQGDKVVSLSKRFDYIKAKYDLGKISPEISGKYQEIETEIFSKLGFKPEELKERIEQNGR
jgi:hypothetical protein